MSKTSFFSNFLVVIILLTCSLGLSACDLASNTLKPDREASLEMQDYRDAMAPRDVDVSDMTDTSAGSVPPLQPYVATTSQSLKSMPLVSISVNQSVPLKDILFELAQQADYDLELDPRITGSIIFTARNRPFDQVVQRISEIARLRYSFDDDVLRVELDAPYNKTYKIDYLSYVRSNTSNISNNVSVVSGDGADTGSSFQTSATSETNFWGELDANLKQILDITTGGLMTDTDPTITAAEQNPNVQAVAPTGTGPDGESVVVQPPQAVLNVSSLPTTASSTAQGGMTMAVSTYSINKQAGLINVYAPERAHKEIEKYLKILKKSSTSQVLIEAKVLEVILNDKYATGIDWRAIDPLGGPWTLNYLTGAGNTALNGGINATTQLSPSETASSGVVVGYTGGDVQGLIQAVSEFGTVRALASPRLTVLNNQSAVLNVATNRVYFELDVERTDAVGDNPGSTTIDSQIRNIPEGIVINVQPSINNDNQTVSMAVRPTITSVVGQIPDPAVAFLDVDIESNVPEVNVQEIDSVIQVRSGQPIVMGGLLQDRVISNENGIPVVSEIPVMGALFKQHADSISKTELVVFLKATILETPGDSIHDTDKDLYRAFSSDRRPFKM